MNNKSKIFYSLIYYLINVMRKSLLRKLLAIKVGKLKNSVSCHRVTTILMLFENHILDSRCRTMIYKHRAKDNFP
jgi:hypothetical protein